MAVLAIWIIIIPWFLRVRQFRKFSKVVELEADKLHSEVVVVKYPCRRMEEAGHGQIHGQRSLEKMV